MPPSLKPLANERVELPGLDLAGVNDVMGESYDDGSVGRSQATSVAVPSVRRRSSS